MMQWAFGWIIERQDRKPLWRCATKAKPAKAGDAKLRGYRVFPDATPVEPPNHTTEEGASYAYFHSGSDRLGTQCRCLFIIWNLSRRAQKRSRCGFLSLSLDTALTRSRSDSPCRRAVC